ncbi:hypothetical protein RRG08_007195 [Elysia crispata]|uniref:MADF domain-containing protein n=1 Tax=Elysia crispata TaxID=231223 RepID=A0AAE1EAH7_9GAST|nr:hypothetical protein RRG08_007195 [Elysia crispata]
MDTLNEALIAAVQKRQPLYDKSDDNYSNRVFIAKQWQEIGQEIGINDQTARKKWTTLRDYFQKTHRQLTNTKYREWDREAQEVVPVRLFALLVTPYR